MNAGPTEVFTPPVVELDVGPGERLRSAREAISLSVEEVAARLHLDTRTISNLEADNYDELPAPTFVRGYLRSYARLLNIAAEPIIDGFDRRGLEPPPLVADISTSDEVKASDPTMKFATIVIAVVLLSGVAIWAQSQFDVAWLTQDGSDGVAEGSGGPTLRPPDAVAPGGSDTGSLPVEGPTQGTQPLVVTEPATPAQTDPIVPVVQPPQPETTAATEVVNTVGRLVLRVRASSWIEVYDRDGERRYYGTGKAGDTIDVEGPEPFNVLLGFADGVRVEYNGQQFDPEPFTARGLARFKLGEG